MTVPVEGQNAFLARHKENELLNQYWYSKPTIEAIIQELLSCGISNAAFISTPSLYFSLPKGSELRAHSWVLDFDKQWDRDTQFCWYDFNQPEQVPESLRGTFDCVVIDPPFITEDVWLKYATTAKLLLKPQGKVLTSTVQENAQLMDRLFSAQPVPFKPSIPHLVYQYCLFANFTPTASLAVPNPEIPEDN